MHVFYFYTKYRYCNQCNEQTAQREWELSPQQTASFLSKMQIVHTICIITQSVHFSKIWVHENQPSDHSKPTKFNKFTHHSMHTASIRNICTSQTFFQMDRNIHNSGSSTQNSVGNSVRWRVFTFVVLTLSLLPQVTVCYYFVAKFLIVSWCNVIFLRPSLPWSSHSKMTGSAFPSSKPPSTTQWWPKGTSAGTWKCFQQSAEEESVHTKESWW